MTAQVPTSAAPAPPAPAGGAGASPRRRRRFSLLTRGDKLMLGLMVGIPSLILVVFILIPTFASVVLSFTSWNGIGGLDKIQFVGLKNYTDLVTIYKPFWPAVRPHCPPTSSISRLNSRPNISKPRRQAPVRSS